MFSIKYFLLVLFCLYNLCGAYKLLVLFPFPSRSHSILGEGYVKHLVKAGHEVTYISPMPLKNTAPNLRQIDVSSNIDILPTDHIMNIEKMMTKEVDLDDITVLFGLTATVANATLRHENVQKILLDPKEEFDVLILEWMYSEVYSGLSAVFNCPYIWSSSMDPHFLVLSLIDEHTNPAYSADICSSEIPPFTFWQRAKKLFGFFDVMRKKWQVAARDNAIYQEGYRAAITKRGRTLPPLDVMKYNASLMLGNSHVSSGQAIRLPQNYIPIAGYHMDEEAKPLPENLQKIMDDAKHGVIYFSMGSMLKSDTLPERILRGLLDVFGELKQTVIWKLTDNMRNVPKNVHVVGWAPQQSILAHPNCILFITHGGLLSTTETLYYGVPTIGIPMFADQFNNVNRAVNKGFAIKVDLNDQVVANLKEAIREMLENPRYRQRAKELSLVDRDRRTAPGADLVHWVEHVVKTRGAPHLRSPALDLTWYQKMYLDLLAVVLLVVYLAVRLTKSVFSKKENKPKKKRN